MLFCDAVGAAQKSFVDASNGLDKILSSIVGHTKCRGSASPGSSLAYSANCWAQRDDAIGAFDSAGIVRNQR